MSTSVPTIDVIPAKARRKPSQKRGVGRSPYIHQAPNATKIGALTPSSVALVALVVITAELKSARSAPKKMPAMIAARRALGVAGRKRRPAANRHGMNTQDANNSR